MKQEKKRCNLYIDKAVAAAGKKKAIDLEISFAQYVENLIRFDLYQTFLENKKEEENERLSI